MRVLWFSVSTSLYDKVHEKSANHYHGGGWIESLEELVTTNSDIKLGVSFFHPSDEQKLARGNVTYYPILRKKPSIFRRLLMRWSGNLPAKIEENYIKNCQEIIEDFKPDLIHVFGTESFFGSIQSFTKVPVVLHLQGILNPCMNAYYPPQINGWTLAFIPFYFIKHLLGSSLLFEKLRFDKLAKGELSYFKEGRYFMGRTEWDKGITALLSPNAQYFHVDEVLRQAFYDETVWKNNEGGKLIIVSTLSPTIYKGLDVILKTAELLQRFGDIDFEWRVIGIDPGDSFTRVFEYIYKKRFASFNIIFSGRLQQNKLLSMLKAGNIFVHPSYIDNSPNSVCEAQIIGMPVIACNVGGLSSLIKNGESGILVPSNAPFELAFQIKRLSMDKDLVNRLSSQGRLAAQKRHDKDKIISALLSTYEAVIQQNNIKNKVN